MWWMEWLPFSKESPDWTFKCLSRWGSTTKDLPSCLPVIYSFGWIALFSRSPKYPEVSAPAGNDLLYSPGKADGNTVSKVPGCFSKGLCQLYKVNLSSLKLFGHIWVYTCLSQMGHSSQNLGNITSFQLHPLLRRRNSYLTYANITLTGFPGS